MTTLSTLPLPPYLVSTLSSLSISQCWQYCNYRCLHCPSLHTFCLHCLRCRYRDVDNIVTTLSSFDFPSIPDVYIVEFVDIAMLKILLQRCLHCPSPYKCTFCLHCRICRYRDVDNIFTTLSTLLLSVCLLSTLLSLTCLISYRLHCMQFCNLWQTLSSLL